MKKPKAKPAPQPRNRLSEGEMSDIEVHLHDRIRLAVRDAVQLIEDPKQAGQLVFHAVVGAFDGSIEMLMVFYELDTGQKISREQMAQALAIKCLHYASED